ncbi:MAG: MlaD family protein [Betaproteobacteria bacterium]|nr:MlaD family protein [Betaproteobacteria bacterium]
MEDRAHALIAGIFAIAFIIAAVLVFWWFGGKHEETRDFLVVSHQSVTGLGVEGHVRYRGIRIGRVESIALDPVSRKDILVRISIASSTPVTKGTYAKLGYQGLTGIAHVQLDDDGNDPSPFAAQNDDLPRIPMRPSLLEELSEDTTETLNEVRKLLANLNTLLTPENRRQIERILANTSAASEHLNASLAATERLLQDENMKRIGPSIANIEGATKQAQSLLEEIRALTPRLGALLEKTSRAVESVGDSGLAETASQLNETARDVGAASRQLHRFLDQLEAAPQSLILGAPAQPPGPGEPGFKAAKP